MEANRDIVPDYSEDMCPKTLEYLKKAVYVSVKPDATEEQLCEALRMAVAEFVLDLPLGLDTPCGESGAGLSEGQAQRIAIARGLLRERSVILLDEPTAGLDPKGRDVILKSVCDYQKQENAVVLLVSHSMEDVAKVADKVLVMNGGKLQMFGKTAEVFSRQAELCEMGLNIPKVMQIVSALRERGADLPDGILTVADAEKAILRLVKDGGENA